MSPWSDKCREEGWYWIKEDGLVHLAYVFFAGNTRRLAWFANQGGPEPVEVQYTDVAMLPEHVRFCEAVPP
jgi:hypothetical protein